ncbi:hypothetical protein CTAYLR_009972 [Chrysophaeum taylorii]|uniref:Uncharacterized protein n=1 Tax=Chrysophaeum taylorii TaxID=2483200 RepID=A0AAD7U857_9STRA|nr:hypothetical protein CTAYLR_009972 [Chrysophaeum taylorii]
MSEEGAMVAVNEETVKTSASISSAAVGLVLGGPIFAVIAAVAGNYVATQDSEVGEVARGVGKVSIDVLNFLLRLNQKYDLSTKASDAATDAVAKLKEKDTDGTLDQVTKVLSDTSGKITEINDEYDLVGKSKQAISYAGELSTKAIDKGIELNDEYKIVDKVTEAVKTTVEKGVDAAKKANA